MNTPKTDELEKRGLNTLALCKKALSLSRKMEKQNALLRQRLAAIHRSTGSGTDAEFARDEAHRISSPNAEVCQPEGAKKL